MSKEITDKFQILQTGGDQDESDEPIDRWLAFLTNPHNLRPGLPDLAVYFGSARFCSIKVTFDSSHASLRSLKIELNYIDDDDALAFFQETDPHAKMAMSSDAASGLMNPHGLKDWIFGIFLQTELEELSVRFLNPELPDLFNKLPKLRNVNMGDSKLIRLPPSFYQLPILENLIINGVPLSELPSELGNLHTLRYLSFSQPCAPSVLGSLDGLTELHCHCQNFNLPGEIAQLTNLKSLLLTSVSSASDNFLNFPKLELLNFQVSRSSATFIIQGNVPSLKELTTNRPAALATIIADSKNLEKLSINGKANESDIKALQKSLKHLSKLTYLSLLDLGIADMEFCLSLTNLVYLDLSGNAIVNIPSSLGNLQKLKKLILNKNPIVDFPDLPVMPALHWLEFAGTRIPEDEHAPAVMPASEVLQKLAGIFPNAKLMYDSFS
jgi:Leucine-rich repeat (LRR) protein